jgi:uncharacterized protein YbjT (DUF2867 family)
LYAGNFYLRTKGDLEEKIRAIGFNSLIILRPSFILGDRKEFRLGEKIGIVVFKVLTPLMVGGLKKYRGVKASDIAQKMVDLAHAPNHGVSVISSEQI